MSRPNCNSPMYSYYSRKNWQNAKITGAVLLIINLFLSGCAYYNYLYHAKKHFETGEKELRNKPDEKEKNRKKKTSSAYKNAIESAGRMLDFYPDSRWEEEALLLLAKSYYRVTQFRKSIAKVDEISAKYPESMFLDEASLWKGMSLLKVSQPDSAREILMGISNSGALSELYVLAHQALGDYYYDENRWDTAKKEYKIIVDIDNSERWMRERAVMMVSDCLRNLNQNEEALTMLGELLSSKPRGNTKFEAAFQYASVLFDLEQYEQAHTRYTGLLKNVIFESEFPRVELEIARCALKMGEIDEARQSLEELIEVQSRGEVAAETHYELGMLYWIHHKDIIKSHEALKGTKNADRNSEFSAKADSVINEIEIISSIWQRMEFVDQQLAILDSSIAGLREIFPQDTVFTDIFQAQFKSNPKKRSKKNRNYKGREDPLERMVIEARKAEKDKELLLDSTLVDTISYLDSMQIDMLYQLRELQLQQVIFEIANHYLFMEEFRDSSLYYFNIYLDNDLNDDSWGKAISSISYIHSVKGDSVEHIRLDNMLLERIQEGKYAERARRNLGLDPGVVEVDTFAVYFKAAEDLWLTDNDPVAAREVYLNISEMADSASDVRARALYASAYLSRHVFGEDSIAQGFYRQVKEEFQGSDIAKSARDAINLAFIDYTEQQVDENVIIPQNFGQFDEMPEQMFRDPLLDPFFDADYVDDDNIYYASDVDDIPVLTTLLSFLESYQQSHYPLAAIADELLGQVELEFVIGFRGELSDIMVLSEDPLNFDFGEAAIEVLRQLEYRQGRHRGNLVKVRMKQRFIFSPPK